MLRYNMAIGYCKFILLMFGVKGIDVRYLMVDNEDSN